MSAAEIEKSKKYMTDGSGECEGISRDEGEDLAALMEQGLRDYDDCVDESFMEKDRVSEVTNSRGYERFIHKEGSSSVTTPSSSTTLYGFQEDSISSSSSAAQELETVPKQDACAQQNLQFKEMFNDDKVEHLQSMLAEGECGSDTVPNFDSCSVEVKDEGDNVPDDTTNADEENGSADGKDSEVEGMTCSMLVYDNDESSEDKETNVREEGGNAVEYFVSANNHLENMKEDLDVELMKGRTYEKDGNGIAGDSMHMTDELPPVPEAMLCGREEIKISSAATVAIEGDQEPSESVENLGVNTDVDMKEGSSSLPEKNSAKQAESVLRPLIVCGNQKDGEQFLQNENRDVIEMDDKLDEDIALAQMHSTQMNSGSNSEDGIKPGNEQNEPDTTNPGIDNITVTSLLEDSKTNQDLGMEECIDVQNSNLSVSVSVTNENDKDKKDKAPKDQKNIVSDDECYGIRDSHIEDALEQIQIHNYPVSDDTSTASNFLEEKKDDDDDAEEKAALSPSGSDVTRNSNLKTDTCEVVTEQKEAFLDGESVDKITDLEASVDQDITSQKISVPGDKSDVNRSTNLKDSLEEELMDMDGGSDMSLDGTDKLNDVDDFVSEVTTKDKAEIEELTVRQTKTSGVEDKQKHLETDAALFEEEKNGKMERTEKLSKVQQGTGTLEITKEQNLNQSSNDAEAVQNISIDAVNRTVSNVARVKRKLEEILETSKAEEAAAIQELEKMKKEKTQILNKLTSEMVRLKTLLLRDKDRKQEK